MNCNKCETILTKRERNIIPLELFDFKHVCEKCVNTVAEKLLKQHKNETGRIFMDGEDNFNDLLEKFVEHVAEFQVQHRLSFEELNVFPKIFENIVSTADEKYLTIYWKILVKSGMKPDGSDL